MARLWHVLGSTIHGLHGSGLCHRWRVETWCLTSYLWIYPSHSLGNPEKWIGVWLMWTLVIPQYQGAYTVGKIAEDLQDDSWRNIGLNNSPVQSKWHNSDLEFASGHYLESENHSWIACNSEQCDSGYASSVDSASCKSNQNIFIPCCHAPVLPWLAWPIFNKIQIAQNFLFQILRSQCNPLACRALNLHK